MKRLLAALCIVLLPGFAHAETLAAAQPTAPAAGDSSFLTTGNVAAVGVGALAGLAVLHGAFCVPPAISAIVGGLGGHWWYRQYEAEQAAANLNYRKPSHFAVTHIPGNETQRIRWVGAADSGL
ncbi:MAG: hypothetical protein H7841_02395 [Magnetospirillum sp. WYHS-4]